MFFFFVNFRNIFVTIHLYFQVVVDCPSSGDQQVFLCQKWLADDEGDQLIERDLYESEDMRLKRRPSMQFFREFGSKKGSILGVLKPLCIFLRFIPSAMMILHRHRRCTGIAEIRVPFRLEFFRPFCRFCLSSIAKLRRSLPLKLFPFAVQVKCH